MLTKNRIQNLNLPKEITDMISTAYANNDWDLVKDAIVAVHERSEEKSTTLGQLFIKYISHVIDCGGCSFLDTAFTKGGETSPVRPFVVKFTIPQLRLLKTFETKIREKRG